jgi:hypothetical protein
MAMKYVLPCLACHNSIVSPQRLSRAAVLALALASLACQKSGAECVPPPVMACPDGGGPSFDTDVLPVFQQVCDNCHAPDGSEASRPLTTYREIYGPATGPSAGSEAIEIRNQVFLSCLMPPSNAPVPLGVDQRQTLLVWFACGALDSPAVDAGARD